MGPIKWSLFLAAAITQCTCRRLLPSPEPPAQDLVSLAGAAVSDLLQEEDRGASDPKGTLILICDGRSSSASPSASFARLSQEVLGTRMVGGLAVLELKFDSMDNVTEDSLFNKAVRMARKVRQRSWVVQVLVVSDDPAFLAAFARWSLRGRLLVWRTRLVVVTRLPGHDLHDLLAEHWTLAMMNALVLNLADEGPARGGIYVHLPYSASGPGLKKIGFWAPATGVVLLPGASLYYDKYSNFHGAPVNVTALPFAPYWSVEEAEGAAGGAPPLSSYSGTDFLMLRTVAETLNFSVNVLPTKDWGEVTQLVEDRVSFMAPIIYAVLPGRLEHYDYTYAYEYASPAFCMTKPVLRPQWQSLYYPLSDLVWLSALAVLVIVPPTFFFVGRAEGRGDIGVVTLVYGTLLNQCMSHVYPKGNSSRLLLGAWLLFTFILGTAYRGNLTAALTLPKYPPRPETLQELVKAVKRVTMPPYGAQFRDFYMQSDSEVFRALARSMEIVPSVQEGLQQASERRQAHIQARRFLELVVAEGFTEADGTTRLYLGRESVFPGLSAWPLPHDAPYKARLDRCIMAIKEAGLYEKWSRDLMEKARKEGRQRQQRILRERRKQEGQADAQQDTQKAPESSGNSPKALTIVHLQGPLMLAALGLGAASVTFVGEMAAARWL